MNNNKINLIPNGKRVSDGHNNKSRPEEFDMYIPDVDEDLNTEPEEQEVLEEKVEVKSDFGKKLSSKRSFWSKLKSIFIT